MPLLTGTRVLAFENGLAGPLATRLLLDLGAEVIKVERPDGGDVTRSWDSVAAGLSSGFVWVNRGKRSIALDVKDPASRPAIERLIERSDVFLQNYTPGWAERVGLGEEARGARPDVVYVDVSGYGPDGPYARKNAYDLVMQEAGLIAVTGTPAEPARVGVSICDVGAASYAAVATLGALARRAETGEGARVSVSSSTRWSTGSATSPHVVAQARDAGADWHAPSAVLSVRPVSAATGGSSASRCCRRTTGALSASTCSIAPISSPKRGFRQTRAASNARARAGAGGGIRNVAGARLARPARSRAHSLWRGQRGLGCRRAPTARPQQARCRGRLARRADSGDRQPVPRRRRAPAVGVPALGEHTEEILRELGL